MTEKLAGSFSLEKAIVIAESAHIDQVDKRGKPYIDHPRKVMDQLQGSDAQTVGILHDVVEDSELTFEDLTIMGCPPKIVDALKLLTHPPEYQGTEEEYMAYINTIAESNNQLAIDVKYADLTHNSDISRIPNPAEKDYKRAEKYKRSITVLRPSVSKYLLKE